MIRKYRVLDRNYRGVPHTKTVVSEGAEEPIDETFSREEIEELLNHYFPGYEWREENE